MQKDTHYVFQSKEINKIFDMEEEHYLGLMKLSKVAKAPLKNQ